LKIFTAVLATETNTFSPICIDQRAFEASLYAPPGTHPDTPTLCSAPITVGRKVATLKNWHLVEGTAAWADPAGLVNRETYETLRDEILDQLRAAMPVDGVVLGLHGAMVAAGYDDPEGDFLARIRSIVGKDTLVCAELDPHSHLTAKRLAAADFFVAFKEFPHTDFVEQAENLWHLAGETLVGNIKPAMSSFDCKMIDIFPTSRQPMRGFVERMKALEKSDPDILSISAIHGFMAGDVPEMGTHIIVVTNAQKEKGDRLAKKLGLELFALRGKSLFPLLCPAEAVCEAIAQPAHPVVIADVWDNPGGGTAGDATVILEEILSQKATNIAFGSIWDPVAVQICIAAGEGAEIPLRFGAKSAPGTGNPVDARVRVKKIVHDAHMRFGQSSVPFGNAVVVEFDDIEVVLNSTRAQCFDASLFEVMGIEPASKDVLVIKSTNHFFDSFDNIASRIIYCSAGTPYPTDPKTTRYLKAPKDIWPLVDDPHAKAG